EGVPDHPGPDRLWAVVERHRVSVLGVAPTVVRALMRHGDEPVAAHDLSSLRVLGSSGEPWNTEPWLWFHERVGGGRCPAINYSGGTEVSDDTIKVAGKRLGPAEVESALVGHPAVAEAAAIGVPDDLKGEALVAFVVLKTGVQDDPDLRRALARRITDDLGKALAPRVVEVV